LPTSWAKRWFCLWLFSTAGCAEPLEAPSAYEDERYLCNAEHAAEFDAMAAACAEDFAAGGSCKGVISMKGEIDGQRFVVDDSTAVAMYRPTVPPRLAESLDLYAQSPYFLFRFSILAIDQASDGGTACVPSGALFNQEVRGASSIQSLRCQSCEFAWRHGGFQFAFSGTLARGGTLDGCMFVQPPRSER
jgi:hypothetical protein